MTSYPGPSLHSNAGPNPNPELFCAGVVEPKPELRPEPEPRTHPEPEPQLKIVKQVHRWVSRLTSLGHQHPSLNPSPSSTQLPLRYAVALFEGLALQGPLGNVERLRVRIATGNA